MLKRSIRRPGNPHKTGWTSSVRQRFQQYSKSGCIFFKCSSWDLRWWRWKVEWSSGVYHGPPNHGSSSPFRPRLMNSHCPHVLDHLPFSMRISEIDIHLSSFLCYYPCLERTYDLVLRGIPYFWISLFLKCGLRFTTSFPTWINFWYLYALRYIESRSCFQLGIYNGQDKQRYY